MWSSQQGHSLIIGKRKMLCVSCCLTVFCAGLRNYATTVYINVACTPPWVIMWGPCPLPSQQTQLYEHLCLRPMEHVRSTSQLLLLVIYQSLPMMIVKRAQKSLLGLPHTLQWQTKCKTEQNEDVATCLGEASELFSMLPPMCTKEWRRWGAVRHGARRTEYVACQAGPSHWWQVVAAWGSLVRGCARNYVKYLFCA